MKGGFVYILVSASGVLYTGVTSSLDKRILQHRFKTVEGFTKKYNVMRLAYYERHPDIRAAIAREKQIKGWTRKKKIPLIEASNLTWIDLAEGITPRKPD
jgi:putative endonuclease